MSCIAIHSAKPSRSHWSEAPRRPPPHSYCRLCVSSWASDAMRPGHGWPVIAPSLRMT